MKKRSIHIHYTLCAVAAMLLGSHAVAQNTIQRGNVTIRTDRLEQREDSLYLDMTLTLTGKPVHSRQTAEYTPLLVTGSVSKPLPEVSVMGRNAYKNHRRTMALMNRRDEAAYRRNMPYAVVPGYKKGDKTVDYRLAIPYELWMSTARLDLKIDDCGCGEVNSTDVRMLASKIDLEKIIVIERYSITPRLAYQRPALEVIKRRVDQGESHLDFAVNRTEIKPEFGRNAVELEKIRRMIELAYNDKDVTIKHILIAGYASPEGRLDLNQRLSEGRAQALLSYLRKRYPDISRELYSVRFGGENWDDLVKAVKDSDMAHADEVLDMIDRYPVTGGREVQLMRLAGGAPWRYMLREMFPALRKVTVVVDYDVKNFSPEQAREIVKTRPQNLSLNEMFAVAQLCEPGSEEFSSLFETAVRLFPDDSTANLNAAVAALERGDWIGAERYLGRIRTRSRIPEYDNAVGVLYMMRDQDYDKAEGYFKSAAEAGLTVANANLDEIGKMRENLDRIKEAELKHKR